jgi:oxygen-independent coproporphyrinogen-3 oxidase
MVELFENGIHRYCDFAIVPIGTTNNTTQAHAGGSSTSSSTLFDVYTHAIIQEIESLGSSSADQQQVTLTSIYLGGGTPSLAPLAMLQAIVQAIRRTFRVALDDDDVEFTMEMDPGTFDQRALEGYQRLGVNRISLGVQSFDNDVLAYLGRQHRLDDIQESLRLLRQVYGSSETTCNYSLDLIASLPGVSPAAWCDTLSQAMRLDPKPSHVSVYDLTIEAGTVFGRWYDNTNNGDKEDIPTTTNKTTRRLPSSTESAFQYQYTAGYLAARGYEHYEISSYAVPGRRSRHNQLYWGYESTWYAVGLGATSYQPAQGGLVARPRAMADYVAWVAEARPAALSQAESTESLLQDLVMKRLRTKEGIDIDHVRDKFGPRYGDAILEGSYLDLDGLAVHEPPFLRLVDSKGFLFSNSIISNIFLAIEGVE